ncbi:MAG: glycosyltransferase involved in cell wall biosynthesis [Halioglobus sp.]|jgi:glycosyltransferase involved in cell wall biosynthesis
METQHAPILGLIVPCFNEEQVLPSTSEALVKEMRRLVAADVISSKSCIYFVDDGSSDKTWEKISELAATDPMFGGIKLARNYGHQYAVYAGLMETKADAYISLDADLQDDIAAIEKMMDSFARGNEIVYGVRENRDSDTLFKRFTARVHYWLLAKMGIRSVQDHADFRLMSHRAVKFLGEYKEVNLYLRGIVPLLGLPSEKVYYTRGARLLGESKYPFSRMLNLSLQGLTSFSILPLRVISMLGLLVFLIALGLGGWALAAAFGEQGTAPGWASTVIPIYLLGGLQLLAIGIAGEYVGKTFMESKGRPMYQVETRLGQDE